MKVLKIAIIVIVIAAAAAAGAVYYVMQQLMPAEPAGIPVIVEIPEGKTSAQIADILEEAGIVRSGTVFAYYLKYKGLGSNFQAGTYEMTPGMTLVDIIDQLSSGRTVKEEVLRFTVPEGFTASQIIELLSNKLGFSQEELAGIVSNRLTAEEAKASRIVWAAEIPENPNYKFALEGYLFPETYELPKDSAAGDAVLRMLHELDLKVKQLPEGWEEQLKASGLTFHKLLTVASLIEREVSVDKERKLVAGVIYNRLKKEMPLQLDATVQYVFGKQKERLFEKDLQIESPYNTYLHPGLPPGPIASPGLKSIEAALYPEASNFLFYVTKKDGSGEHLFAETYKEHLENIKKSKQAE
ncbi:endolytic transglycosylase MltG [Paenibacillus thermotolerans]|uniref:endolytic transglycosylase MltG n=1 Tax=Paenibacillus thermotolerans TaxID=3027807 RepID=UPI0023678729|nr:MULTISPECIES: endolytic transglycosylase MltG [unclassified Paenibacillus]